MTSGSNWQLQPQDSPSGVLAAQVIFDRTVGQPIRVREFDFDAGTSALVNTTGAWLVDQYFQFEMVFDRKDQSLEFCLDGSSIYIGGDAFVSGLLTDVFLAMETGETGTAGNTLDVDALSVESGDAGGCAAPRGVSVARNEASYAPRRGSDANARAVRRSELQPMQRHPR